MLKEAFARLSRHTLVYAVTGQLSRVVSFVLVPFYTSHLSEADYGINSLLSHAIAVLGYLAGVNMTSAMARHYFDRQEPGHRRLVVSTTLWSVLAGSLLVGGALALFAGPLGRLVDPERAGTARLVLLTLGILVLQLLREVWFRFLQTEERSGLFGAFAVGKVVLEVSLQVLFIAGFGRGLVGLFEAVLVSEAVAVLALGALLLPRTGLGFSRPVFGLLLAFTLPLVPNGILQFFLHSGDRYLLRALAGNEQVGLYDFAYKFGYIPNYLLLTPFLMVWYPFVFSLGSEARQREIIGRFAPYFMFLLTAAVLAVSLLAEEVATVMAGRPGYVPAWRAIAPVCFGYWLWGAFQLVQTGFYVRKATARLPLLTGLAAAVNLGLNLALIPRFGYLGAAWATAATFLFLLVVTARAVRGVFPVDFPWRRIVAPAAWAGAALGAGLTLPAVLGLEGDTAASAALKAALGIAWLAAMWAGGFLSRDERRALLETLRRRKAPAG